MGSADDGAHSQNEKLNRRDYAKGTKTLAAYLYEASQLKNGAPPSSRHLALFPQLRKAEARLSPFPLVRFSRPPGVDASAPTCLRMELPIPAAINVQSWGPVNDPG